MLGFYKVYVPSFLCVFFVWNVLFPSRAGVISQFLRCCITTTYTFVVGI